MIKNLKSTLFVSALFLTVAAAFQLPDADADADANVAPKLTEVKKVLVMGNSLTKHGPSTAALGWKHNFGMAATSQEKDYVHTLFEMIRGVQQPEGRVPELKIVSMLATNIHTPQDVVDYAADYIVLQMGDNLPAPKATEEILVKPYVQLVKNLKEANPKATIFITGIWGGGPDDVYNKLIKQVCDLTGATFVDLRPIAANPENRASSEGVYAHRGVAWHPGDRGMKRIAEAIWEKTQEKFLQESPPTKAAAPQVQPNDKSAGTTVK